MKAGLMLAALAGLAGAGASEDSFAQPGRGCSKAAVSSAGAAVRAALAELRATPLEADGTLVPPATSSRIERVKDRVRTLVRARMDCAEPSPAPAMLGARLQEGVNGPAVTAPRSRLAADQDGHGEALGYSVVPVDSHPDMLAVVATLGIKCGSDSMLMLYGREAGRWRELMVRRSAPYGEVKGGWGDLRFAVSPPDSQGKWFVATVSTTPWCTSAWQGMPYELARPGPAPERPNVFFRGKNTIYLGNDADLMLKAEPGAFEIRHDGSSIDSEVLVRRHLLRFRVEGNSVRRVQPVAETVRDFVDEWIEAEWAQAKSWSAPRPSLAAAHSAVKAARWKTLGGFASVRGCKGGLTQVEIGDEAGPGWFFLVRDGTEGPWTVERSARQAASDCTGPSRIEPGTG